MASDDDFLIGTIDIGHAAEDRYPGVQQLARWLTPNPNLPPAQLQIAQRVERLGSALILLLPDGPELTAGLRKLLEAKDCFVRASME